MLFAFIYGRIVMGRLFGTDGVRGVANVELTADLAFRLGQAGACVLAAETHHIAKILVGMDTRISGAMLESALVAGICSVGAEAVCLGVIPTPAVAYLTRKYKADAGVVISASHNPFEFNGIKFFDSRGYKLPDHIECKIEELVLNSSNELPCPSFEKIGRKHIRKDALSDYTAFIKSSADVDLTGLKVLIDCANGAAYQAAPNVLEELGAQTIVINNEPDGVNINSGCGSTHMENIRNKVKESGFDAGIAFDGDADRVLAVDEKGNLVDGDQIMSIIGLWLKKEGKLDKNTIVATIMSNMGFDLMAEKEGLNIVKTRVGDRYVLEEMINSGYVFGGEQSGHVIFLKHNTTGDGLLTAVKLLAVMKKTGKRLSQLASVMTLLPQVLKNAKVSNDKKHKYHKDDIIMEMKRKMEMEFNGTGRILVRPSGTEPLIRVMIEGKDQIHINSRAEELVKIIEMRLG